MKLALLELLRCPFCQSCFEIDEIFKQNGNDIIDACVKCECDTYPILQGILIIKNIDQKDYIIKYLRKGETNKAIGLACERYSNEICRVWRFINGKLPSGILNPIIDASLYYLIYKNKGVCSSDNSIPFFRLLGSAPTDTYFKHRFSSQTLWALYPFVPLMREFNDMVLDVCCGMGHSSFILSRYCTDNLISVDNNYLSLYLAKKYFAASNYICVDVNLPLPFKDEIFSCVVMVDALHYIESRSLVINEIERVLDFDGLVLIPHVHNSLVNNLAEGKPLTPTRWKALFKHLNIKLLPEKDIICNFLENNTLDLTKKYSSVHISQSNSFIITNIDEKVYADVWQELRKAKESYIINPIYDIKDDEDGLLLFRKFPSEFFKEECPLSAQYLPEKYMVKKTVLENPISNSLEFEDLIKRFILINVPYSFKDCSIK